MDPVRLSQLREKCDANPGGEEFVELATALSADPATRPEAREVCFRGLTHHPKNLSGRLLLARLFYLDQMPEFCARELLELRKLIETPSLLKLLKVFEPLAREALAPVSAPSAAPETAAASGAAKPETTVGELDLDVDFLDALDEVEEEK